MDDCIHQIDLCPTCGGPSIVRLDRVEGITSLQLDDEPAPTDVTVYFGPTPEPCDHAT